MPRPVQFCRAYSARCTCSSCICAPSSPATPRVQRLLYGWDGHLTHLSASAGRTVNKSSIGVCVRNVQGRLEDENVGFLVAAHELGHICTESTGHTAEFWKNFRWLLHEAESMDLYRYQRFEAAPTTYCGAPIDSNPLTCVKDGSCSLGV